MMLVGFVTALAFGLAEPEHGPPATRKLEIWPWELHIPSAMQPVPSRSPAFGLSFAGQHSVLLQVKGVASLGWEDILRHAGDGSPETPRSHSLATAVDLMATAALEGYRKGGTGVIGVEGRIVADFAGPETGHCRTIGFSAMADQTPTSPGDRTVLTGYDMVCADFVEGGETAEFIFVVLSERYCEPMGRAAVPELRDTAEQIFGSLRYLAGPGHRDMSEEGVPGFENLIVSATASRISASGMCPAWVS